MEVNFATTKADYLAFYTYYFFRRKVGWRILIIAVIGLWFGGFRGSNQSMNVWVYSLHVLIIWVVLALLSVIPYAGAVRRLKRQVKATGITERSFTITLTPEGFSVLSPGEEAKFWRWESVRIADSGGGFAFILLFHRELYLIPRNFFSSENEAGNFMGVIKNGIERVRGNSELSLKIRARRLRWWGLAGLIPNFGVIAGLILFFKGIFQFRDRWLVVIGVADVLFTVLFWFTFIRWEQSDTGFIKMWTEMSQDQLNNLFREVEFYKVQHGDYPDSLKQVAESYKNVWITDPLEANRPGGKSKEYFYKKVGDKYWLFSVGVDRKPYTADDIYPQMDASDTAKFGLLLRR